MDEPESSGEHSATQRLAAREATSTPRAEGPWEEVARAQEPGTPTELEPQNKSRAAVGGGRCVLGRKSPPGLSPVPPSRASHGPKLIQEPGKRSLGNAASHGPKLIQEPGKHRPEQGERRKGMEGKWQRPQERPRGASRGRKGERWGRGRGSGRARECEQEGNIRPDVDFQFGFKR